MSNPVEHIRRIRKYGNMTSQKITCISMFEPLLAADPSFLPRWNKFEMSWRDEPEPPLYLALHSLAEHLLERLDAKQTEGFDAVFAVVESWLVSGDVLVREAAVAGLLESLQNLSGVSDRQTATVQPWLGPASRLYWDRLDQDWLMPSL